MTEARPKVISCVQKEYHNRNSQELKPWKLLSKGGKKRGEKNQLGFLPPSESKHTPVSMHSTYRANIIYLHCSGQVENSPVSQLLYVWEWSFGRECSGLFLIIIKTAELLALS